MQVAHSLVRSIELAGHPFKTNFPQTLLQLQLTMEMRDPNTPHSTTSACVICKNQDETTAVPFLDTVSPIDVPGEATPARLSEPITRQVVPR